MLIKKSELKQVSVEHARGGNGTLLRYDHITQLVPCTGISALSYVELKPGVSIGKHQHVGNFEAYCVTEGTGRAHDNGTDSDIGAGDLLIIKDGEYHAIDNTGQTPLKMVAFICQS